jgi:hypothetical protein
MTTKINASTSGLTETVDTSGILEIQTSGGTAVIIGADQNANFATTGAITVPVGTTAQRPTPANGMMRYNSNVSVFEVYANGSWAAANVTPAPTNSVAPVISGSAVVGQNLTSTTGTWSGTPTSYFYQWRANSTSISNATANVFTLTSTQTGANITCNVTAANLAGNSSPATSNTLGPVILGTTVNYLIVAGGGSGGGNNGGGGGAGGLQTGTTILQPANTYSITIGAGGASVSGSSLRGINGSNTTFSAVSNASVGGGGGGCQSGTTTGYNGGSGGGGAYSSGSGGSGTTGQGTAGGSGAAGGGCGGGGGGASQAGGNADNSQSGYGGNGTSSTITGVATYYAGGGGGGNADYSPGAASLGGGGRGGYNGNTALPGSANLGGGGGGGSTNASNTSGAGGSGVVIISYSGAQAFGGGVITTDGSNTIHTFYTSGSLVPITSLTSNYLVVAGGGAGGTDGGGGGGAGGLITGSSLIIDSSSTYVITVGAGGTGSSGAAAQGANGSNSSFSAIANVAVGGGGGGAYGLVGRNGGSGGGGSTVSGSTTAGGTGTSGQGFGGGTGFGDGSTYSVGGGGGGSSQAGANATSSVAGGGGNGTSSSITGTATYYAGGGGGAGFTSPSKTVGAGGLGGGGAGGQTGSGGSAATSGTSGTGGGGGGSPNGAGSGGGGTVIISYPGSTPQMAGGNVTVVSNTVVHTFTSSGYLTPFVNVNNSLRFRGASSAYLNRTNPVAGASTSTWTWSAWVKRGTLGSSVYPLFTSYIGTANYSVIDFSADSIRVLNNVSPSGEQGFTTTAVYRDPAAWYHIVVSSSASSTPKLYVNGVQVTAISAAASGSSVTTPWYFSSTNPLWIGREQYSSTNNYFDGEMTEIRYVDGQQLTPNAFGTFNQYGVWQPVAYAGSYGTNGFYLPFNSGNTSYAGSFNGSSQFLYLGGQSNFAFGTGDFTVEMMINPTSTSAGVLYDSRPTSTNGIYPMMYFDTNVLYYYVNGNNEITVTGIKTNSWTHIALVKSSGSTKIYVNGVQTGNTYTDGNNYLNGTDRPMIGRSGYASTGFVTGSISNLRVVKGTAVYTGNFTPPTTSLTAITNTQLLTLQNATIVDNSTNAFTINNSGTVTTGQTYPFAYGIFNDQGTQGNNWTPNNISGAFGSTLDYMVDVPTLTSANVANYSTMNPLNRAANGTMSGGNLIVSDTDSGAGDTSAGTMSMKSGKYYFEFTRVAADNDSYYGIIRDDQYISSQAYGLSASQYGYSVATNGTLNLNGTTTGSWITAFSAGNVCMVAYDAATGNVWFGRNGTWGGSGNPATGSNPAGTTNSYTTYGYVGYLRVIGSGGTETSSVNYGQQPFVYTPPSGFVALNTYNL